MKKTPIGESLARTVELYLEKVHELSIIRRLTDEVSLDLGLDSATRQVLEVLMDELDLSRASIMLPVDSEGGLGPGAFALWIEDRAEARSGGRATDGSLFDAISEAADRALKTLSPVVEEKVPALKTGAGLLVCLPLMVRDTPLGVLGLVYPSRDSFKGDSVFGMTIMANQIAILLDNARNYGRIQQMNRRLEERVKEATRELKGANEELREEVARRARVEERLRSSLNEKDALLHEIHHRVKNNLQVVSSLLDMSLMRTRSPDTIDVLKDSRSRIHAMSLVHTHLYRGERLDSVDAAQYIEKLVDHLEKAYAGNSGRICSKVDSPEIQLSLEQAIPLGLVLNELVSNSFKHAFTNRDSGVMEVKASLAGERRVILRVRDNGVGISEDINIDHSETLGLKLARNIVRKQLGGDIRIKREHGTEVEVEFSLASTDGDV